jgi:hypothetical protein
MVAATSWKTLVDAKISYFPFDTGRLNKHGEPIIRFIPIGIRCEFADGSWWFSSYKTGSFTKHWTGSAPAGRGFNGLTVVPVERKDTFTPEQVQQLWPELFKMLLIGEMIAVAKAAG